MAREESQLAIQEIQRALATGEHNVYLCELLLTTNNIPELLWESKWLRWLNICDNEIETLSPKLANLIELRRLNVSANYLRELPRELSALVHLQGFSCTNNTIRVLPEEV